MKKSTLLLLTLLTGFAAIRADAGPVPAIETANGTPTTWRNIIGANQSASVGWSFLVGSQNLELSALGIFDMDFNGLQDPHPVGIWTGGGTLLSQVTVPQSTAGVLVGSYRYSSVTPITLTAGQTYVVGTYFGPVVDRCGSACGDPSLLFGAETFTAGITFLQSRQSRAIIGSGPLVLPDLDAGLAQSFFGPNFLVTAVEPVTPAEPAPEPASLGLVGLGVGAMLAGVRRRRRQSLRRILACSL